MFCGGGSRTHGLFHGAFLVIIFTGVPSCWLREPVAFSTVMFGQGPNLACLLLAVDVLAWCFNVPNCGPARWPSWEFDA